MESTKLILGIINTPPLHLTHEELERLYQDFTKPLLSALYRFPDVPLTMFFSGPFLEWLQKHHSEYLTVLADMLKRKQIEILGGGFYSPLLPLIPHNDRIGQIEDLTTTVRRFLGRRPRGAWIAGSIWEPLLVTNLINTGMEFAFLETAALSESKDFLGHYPLLTENQGKTLVVFPYSLEFSQKVMREGSSVLLKSLEARADKDDSILCLMLSGDYWGDDREVARKFVHEGGLEEVLMAFRNSATEIEGSHPSVYMKRSTMALNKIYFNNSTLGQLWLSGETSLQCKDGKTDRRNFRHYLSDYPALNHLYSKMMFVHLLAYQIRRDKYKKKSALEDLWRAQGASAYFLWRDQGAQNSQVRKLAYAHLIQAELKARDKMTFVPSLGLQDFDLDGIKEIIYQGTYFNFYVDPKGGQLFETDCLKGSWNYSDLFSFDFKKNRSPGFFSFIDRFYRHFNPEDFRTATPDDLGDFAHKEYKVSELDREQKTALLTVRGSLQTRTGGLPIKIDKKYTFKDHGLRIHYQIESLSPVKETFIFVPEIRLSFREPSKDKLFFTAHNEVRGYDGGDWIGWSEFHIHDKSMGQRIVLQTSLPGDLTVAPEILNLPDGKALYQGHRFLPRWEINLRNAEPINITLDLVFQTD